MTKENEAEKLNKPLSQSGLKEVLCPDCKLPYAVPFEGKDGKIKCAACAVHEYMEEPNANQLIEGEIQRAMGA